jgi:hypothetical protein
MTAAAGSTSKLRKLLAVDIRVTRLASRRCPLEIRMADPSLGIRRLVAIGTLRAPVSPGQWESSFRMIVVRQLSPGFGGMASLTIKFRSIRRRASHEFVESPFMRICVAALTSQSLPVVLHRCFRFEIRRLLVAVAAWNCNVTSSQPKRSSIVSAKTKCGWEKSL